MAAARTFGCRPSDLWPPRRLPRLRALALDMTVFRARQKYVAALLERARNAGGPLDELAAAVRLTALG